MKLDLTVAAVPAFIAAMGAEFWWQRRHPAEPGSRAGDYQLADTLASLTMGVGSLLAPLVNRRILDPITPTIGRFGRVLVGVAMAASALTTVADVLRSHHQNPGLPAPQTLPDTTGDLARGRLTWTHPGSSFWTGATGRLHATSAVTAVAATALTAATVWAAQLTGEKLFGLTSLDLGAGPWALAAAVLGWDFIYYVHHRLSHECRWLWAVHVVHHSSQRYNLSTALRQPVSSGLTVTVPYGLLALVGVRPELIERARQLNLLYQFWIHTEAIGRLGWFEAVFNTPSHHRVHHGSNAAYLDRNHGSILIVWDRLFGTFEPERDPPVYGLTTNLTTFNPLVIATHEFVDIARDIAVARTWVQRWSFLLRGPGWASQHRARPVAVS